MLLWSKVKHAHGLARGFGIMRLPVHRQVLHCGMQEAGDKRNKPKASGKGAEYGEKSQGGVQLGRVRAAA